MRKWVSNLCFGDRTLGRISFQNLQQHKRCCHEKLIALFFGLWGTIYFSCFCRIQASFTRLFVRLEWKMLPMLDSRPDTSFWRYCREESKGYGRALLKVTVLSPNEINRVIWAYKLFYVRMYGSIGAQKKCLQPLGHLKYLEHILVLPSTNKNLYRLQIMDSDEHQYILPAEFSHPMTGTVSASVFGTRLADRHVFDENVLRSGTEGNIHFINLTDEVATTNKVSTAAYKILTEMLTYLQRTRALDLLCALAHVWACLLPRYLRIDRLQ